MNQELFTLLKKRFPPVICLYSRCSRRFVYGSNQDRIYTFGGPRLDTVMGPLPVFCSPIVSFVDLHVKSKCAKWECKRFSARNLLTNFLTTWECIVKDQHRTIFYITCNFNSAQNGQLFCVIFSFTR